MSSDLSVEKEHHEEVAIAVTTKTGNDDQESNGGEANNDADVSHQPQDLRDIQPLSKDYIGLPIPTGISVSTAV